MNRSSKLAEKIKKSPPQNIDIYLENIQELSCNEDYGKFDRKILNERLAVYLEEYAADITVNYSIYIRLHLKHGSTNDKKIAENLIHEYYTKNTEKLLKNMKKKSKQWRFRLFIGILFLALCHGLSLVCLLIGGESSLSSILQDSFEIIGWVAIWEPALYFIYTKKEETYELSDSIQLEYSTIECVYC